MSKQSEKVKRWRKKTKQRVVDAMGGKCVCCGYKKCNAALDLHHINPEEKEFGLGRIMARPVAWKKIIEELRKCVLVCNRCHVEFHNGVRKLPDNHAKFDESFVEY